MTVSASCPLPVGICLKISTRSLPPSATNSRVPSESANRGKLRVALHVGGYVGLPAASVPFDVVHSTGVSLLAVSAAAVAAFPENALLAMALVISGWPTTSLAGAAFEVGMLFQIRTRL